MSENQTAQATRHELAEGARKHYEQVSIHATDWLSTIPAAIDAWEREPEKDSEIARMKEVERKAIEQSEWVQTKGLTEFERNRLENDVRWLTARVQELGETIAAREGHVATLVFEKGESQREIDDLTKNLSIVQGFYVASKDEVEHLRKQNAELEAALAAAKIERGQWVRVEGQ